MAESSSVIVKCPQCGKPASFSTKNPHRPFCSDRCQTLDLGAWAVERYKIPLNEIEISTVNENTDGEEALADAIPSKDQFN